MEKSKLLRNKSALFIISALLTLIMFLIAVKIGSVKIELQEIVDIILAGPNPDQVNSQIIYSIRIPRALMALFIGASLSVSGVLLQAVMQNPLADPGIIGVSSGASLVAVIILILMPELGHLLPLFAFAGAILATIMVYILAWKDGVSTIRLVLAGVAINALLGGMNSLISVLNADKIQSVILWINGSLASSTWKDFFIIMKYSSIGLILSFFTIRSCNLLLLGDEKATTLGINVHRSRILISLLAAFLAGVATSMVGVIGFVGLVIPHISRMLIGSDYKYLLPFSMLNGGLFLLMTDTLGRTIASPIELPVGTIMSIVGAPFFLYLLRRQK